MNNINQMVLPEDITGIASTNMIVDEIHVLPEMGRIIKPNYTAYFLNSVIVIGIDDNDTEHVLTKHVDYKCTELQVDKSSSSGLEVCGSLLIDESVIYNKFKITYQAYGGDEYPHLDEILQNTLVRSNSNSISFKDVLDKPIGYKPAAHKHDILDWYGLEYIVEEIKYIKKAITDAPNMHDYRLSERINDLFIKYPVSKMSVYFDKDHLTNTLDVHQVTKAQVGLSRLADYSFINTYSLGNEGSYSIDYINATTQKYISNYSAFKFINEYINKQLTRNTNPTSLSQVTLNTINDGLERIDDLAVFCNNNLSTINALNSSVNMIANKEEDIRYFVKQYKHVNWNYEVATIVKFIFLDKFSKTTERTALINVPERFENLYLWLDFSDDNTIIKETLNNDVSVSAINDKSSYHRQFSQYEGISKPRLVRNVGTSGINKYTSCKFTADTRLTKTTGENVLLNNEFTIIALVKNYTSVIKLLNHSSSYIGTSKSSAIISTASNLNIKSNIQALENNRSNLIVISASTVNPEESWCAVNNTIINGLGISSISKGVGSFILSDIGVLAQTDQNFDLAELIIYDRQLSTVEINCINTYLNKKWSTNTEFTLNLDFVKNNI